MTANDLYSEDDIKPENEDEAFRKKVAARINANGTYAYWVADQVDGSLKTVVDAVMAELVETKMRRLNEITNAQDLIKEEARLLP